VTSDDGPRPDGASGPDGPSRRGGAARQVSLVLVAFVATFVLLAGGWAVLSRASSRGTPAPTIAERSPNGSAQGSVGVPPSATPGAPVLPSLTPGPSGEAPSIVLTGAGDIADCSLAGAEKTSDILLQQQGWFFTAGDNAYADGSRVDYSACYAPTWGRVRDRTILPAPGNHDWDTKGAQGYLDYFGPVAAPNGVTWYSRDLGAWHVVVLDSECEKVGGCGANSPQGRWLTQDLASSTAHCTLAIWHKPRFSSGEHGNDPDVGPFWEALHQAGAELVINGHDHDYERFAPMDPSGNEQRPAGIREIVVGTGGGDLRQFTHEARNSEFRQAGAWGVLRLTLHPANYDWEFLPADGQVADSGSALCH